MAYNPDAQTIIIGEDIDPRVVEAMRNQITADVLTAKEFENREQTMTEEAQVAADTADISAEVNVNADPAGDGFVAPNESEIDEVDVAGTDKIEGSDEGVAGDNDLPDPETGEDAAITEPTDEKAVDEANADDKPLDQEADEAIAEDNKQDAETKAEADNEGALPDDSVDPELDPEANSETENDNDVDPIDEEELTEEDLEVEDDLNEPNAALEHATTLGAKELSRYLFLGVDKYRRRVRRQRDEQNGKGTTLAHETIQMEVAQRQNLIRRLLYVKPADTGYTSKLQTFISSIDNPDEWIALVDPEGIMGEDQELTRRQIEEALSKVGVQMFDSVESMANAVNTVQKAITEPGTV